ncbi:High-affnity carbon uptake protein Hat/HatR [hydrothermal vent metagenome]|uniref:High-affnity carbon uptake protein Hat/HatR n=1 Tax=hydrothermal vent metagenome TaxID=652676 RepID=A0A3B0X8K8_9ZZZZ
MVNTPFFRHRGPVTCAVHVPNSNKIITSGYDNGVALFDIETRDVTLLGYHAHLANRVSVNQSGRYAMSASSDHNLYLWDLCDKKLIQILKGHSNSVEDFVFIDDKLGASVSRDSRVILWNLKTGAIKHIMSGHDRSITAISHFDDKLYTTGTDRTLRTWDLKRGEQSGISGPFGTDTSTCAIDAGHERFILGHDDGTIKIFNLSTGQPITQIQGHHSAIKKIVVSPENGNILSAACDQKIRLWDATTFEKKLTLAFHRSLWERSLNWSTDTDKIVAGTFDGTVLVWDIHSGKCTQELGTEVDNFGNACFNDITSQSDGQVTLVSDDGYVRAGILSKDNAQWLHSVAPDSGRVLMNAVTFCPIQKHVITGAHNHTLYLFNNHRQKLKQMLHIELNEGPINCIRTSELDKHKGEIFVACYSGILAHLSADGQLLNKIPAHETTIRALALHPVYPIGVSCCTEGVLASWHYSGKLVKEYTGHNATINDVDIDPSGRFIASAGCDASLKIHGLEDAVLYHNIPLGQHTPTSLHFVSPYVVLVGNCRGDVLRVSLNNGSITQQSIAHNGISAIVRHGEHFAMSSYDGTVYLVEARQLTLLNSLRSMVQQVRTPEFI